MAGSPPGKDRRIQKEVPKMQYDTRGMGRTFGSTKTTPEEGAKTIII